MLCQSSIVGIMSNKLTKESFFLFSIFGMEFSILLDLLFGRTIMRGSLIPEKQEQCRLQTFCEKNANTSKSKIFINVFKFHTDSSK